MYARGRRFLSIDQQNDMYDLGPDGLVLLGEESGAHGWVSWFLAFHDADEKTSDGEYTYYLEAEDRGLTGLEDASAVVIKWNDGWKAVRIIKGKLRPTNPRRSERSLPDFVSAQEVPDEDPPETDPDLEPGWVIGDVLLVGGKPALRQRWEPKPLRLRITTGNGQKRDKELEPLVGHRVSFKGAAVGNSFFVSEWTQMDGEKDS